MANSRINPKSVFKVNDLRITKYKILEMNTCLNCDKPLRKLKTPTTYSKLYHKKCHAKCLVTCQAIDLAIKYYESDAEKEKLLEMREKIMPSKRK